MKPITYGSVCSGIEAATVAWHSLGWQPLWFAEIEPFPSAVLAHHYPHVPNRGDMTKLARAVLCGTVQAPEVLVGGTPCQAFSVAGMREGLADRRGALTIKYVELADAIDHVRTLRGDPKSVIVWENVHGVLSDKENAFGCFLGALVGESEPLEPAGGRWTDAGCVYGPARAAAWRVLDAQYFGLAQRRRRVFVVASARSGFDPAAVLFESDGLRRDTPPRRSAGQDAAAGTLRSTDGGSDVDHARARHLVAFGGNNQSGAIDVATARNACASGSGSGRLDFESETFVVHGTQDPDTLRGLAHPLGRNNGQENAVCVTGDVTHTLKADGFDGSEDGTGCGQPIIATLRAERPHGIAFSCKDYGGDAGDLAPTLRAIGHGASHPNAGGQVAVASHLSVRRLTPRECERLQGFPDDHTAIPNWDGWRKMDANETPDSCRAQGLDVRQAKKSQRWYVRDVDGPRYKAIGNSKAVPVVRWIGRRINAALRPCYAVS